MQLCLKSECELFFHFCPPTAPVLSRRGLRRLQRRSLRGRGQHPHERRQNSRLDIRLREPGSCNTHRVSGILSISVRTDAMTLCVLSHRHFPCQQESLQGALGASHEDDNWLPIPRRHSYQKWFNHQEQICRLRNALCASFIFLVLFVVGAKMFTLLQRLCGMQSGGKKKTQCQIFP